MLPTKAAAAASDGSGAESPAGGYAILRWAGILAAAVGAAGLLAAESFERSGLSDPNPFVFGNIFHRLYVLHERPFLGALIVFGLLAAVWPRAERWGRRFRQLRFPVSGRTLAVVSGLIAAFVLVVSLVGFRQVLHGFEMSADESAASFQARIFSRGLFETVVPAAWQRFGFALTPYFIQYSRFDHTWISPYLPVDSMIRAGMLRLGAEAATNAIFAAATVLLLAAVGRRLWPRQNGNALLAVIFLAASSQFLVMSMTAYAMPANLFFNMLWLYLYLRGDRPSWIALPWVGVLALGVHHPFSHALFVAPFLLRWLMRRRGAWLAYAAGVYGAGVVAWWCWLRNTQPYTHRGGFWLLFSLPRPSDLLFQLTHLAVVFSWQSPVVPVLLLVGVFSWRALPETARDLAAGLGLTFLFYCFFPLGQGHGWGYRYIYGALGSLVILAVFGAAEALSRVRSLSLLTAASLVLTLAWQVPRRFSEVARFVAPFAQADVYVASLKGSIVLVDPAIGWYAGSLVRNEPFLENDPKVLFSFRVSPVRRAELEALLPGRVRELTWQELAALGFPGASPPEAPSRARPPWLERAVPAPGRVGWQGPGAARNGN
jgi:hypothetical protein